MRNVILKLRPEQAEKGLDKFDIVFRFCRLRIEATGRKACVLAPTVKRLKEFLAMAQWIDSVERLTRPGPGRRRLRVRCVVATFDVDTWGYSDWQDAILHCDILLVTPQLFLDAVTAGHLKIDDFGSLAFDECQHCIGSHPFAKIVLRFRNWIRLMGVCECFWKPKHKRSDKRNDAALSLQEAFTFASIQYG